VLEIKSSFYEEIKEKESSLKLTKKGLELLRGNLRCRKSGVRK